MRLTVLQRHTAKAKYQEDSTVYDCPCGLASELEKEIQSTALKVFEITRCEMWGRVDFLLDEAGNHYLLEVNTAPGMTDHSSRTRYSNFDNYS